MYQDRRSVIKVVGDGLNIQGYPDARAMEPVKKQITW